MESTLLSRHGNTSSVQEATEKGSSGQTDIPNMGEFSLGILEKDENNAGHLVRLDLQEKADGGITGEPKSKPLMTVNSDVYSVPTIRLLKELFLSEGTDQTIKRKFIEAVVTTRVMSYARDYLKREGKISGDLKEFKSILDKLWFTSYKRGGEDSSGFKHVFMAEPIRNSFVNGFHNWVFFAVEQANNNIEYLGWFNRKVFANNKGCGLALRFRWKRMMKKLSSMFVGSSPEMEMAVYTVCFLCADGGNDCLLPLENNLQITIHTIPQHVGGNIVIGTAYPVISDSPIEQKN